jgi:Cu2+-exporting ATPase
VLSPPDPSDLRVRHPGPGRVELVSRTLFADPADPFCRRFVSRLFAVPEVESLTIDRGGATIAYASGGTATPALMRRIAAALRAGEGVPADTLHLSAPDGLAVRVRRYGAVISTWEVRHVLPGRLRIRHQSLRGHRGIGDALLEELAAVPGVIECRLGLRTGSLVVVHDPDRVDADELLLRCESALSREGANAAAPPSLSRFAVGSLLLTLAFAGYHVFPPLLVACALLLVAMNTGTFRQGWRSLRTGKLDVDVAYCALILGALLAGDFRSIALTAWFVRSWPLLVDRRLAATRRALGVGERRVERLVRVERSGRELAVPVSSLRPDDVPVDVMVAEDRAALAAHELVHDAVADGAADAIARRRVLDATRVTPDDAVPGHQLADRAATPVLAAAAIGGLTAGVGAWNAVLAPNYYAAPGLGPLHRSGALLECAHAGFLVRDEAALLRLAAADAVLLDAALDAAEADALASGLGARGLASHVAGSAARRRILQRRRRDGLTTAFIGRGGNPALAGAGDVTIALGGSSLSPDDAADIVLLVPGPEGALELLDLARAHARERRLNHRLGLWPNVVAVGSALVIGTPSLVSSALTNLGALAVYWRGSRRLRQAEAAWRTHHT